jgi:hypothetical protein
MPYTRASVTGGFLGKYRELIRDHVLPYQWDALIDAVPGAPRSHYILTNGRTRE